MALSFVSRASDVPNLLVSPNRYTCPIQAHGAGNLLAAVISRTTPSPAVLRLTNLAGDTWLPTASTPYNDVAGAHTHEFWYCLKTKGHPADVVTLFLVGGGTGTDIVFTVYEFAPADPLLTGFQYQTDGVGSNAVDPNNFITTGVMPVASASVVIAGYRNSNNDAPTSPSGTQFWAPSTAGQFTHYDSYQFMSAPGTVFATIPPLPFAQWSIQAAVFNNVGGGCPQDLPHGAASGGVGCAADLPTTALPSGT